MTTLHILSNPYGPVNLNNRMDPFAISTWKFIHYMTKKGWKCIHYSVPGTEVDCETVQCLDIINENLEVNVVVYNDRAGKEIAARKQPGDMVVCMYGIANKGAAEANSDLKIVEPSIGYATHTVFADFRVFTSYAHMHMFYGERGMLMSPNWWDGVIYNAITPEEFEFTEDKDDYFLYFGRVIETKGVHLAIQATEATGKKLIIAGPGDLTSLGYPPGEVPSHVTLVGLCDAEQRKQLMSKAQAVIGPTYYVEPFGNMVVEGFMSGTPAITTDWGGFTETVQHGFTGFRCRTFRDIVFAINNIDRIDKKACREWAVNNCSDQVVHDRFDEYFKNLEDLNFYKP
jgi:glycosyltransferase involved in cell wall biosynthesis